MSEFKVGGQVRFKRCEIGQVEVVVSNMLYTISSISNYQGIVLYCLKEFGPHISFEGSQLELVTPFKVGDIVRHQYCEDYNSYYVTKVHTRYGNLFYDVFDITDNKYYSCQDLTTWFKVEFKPTFKVGDFVLYDNLPAEVAQDSYLNFNSNSNTVTEVVTLKIVFFDKVSSSYKSVPVSDCTRLIKS